MLAPLLFCSPAHAGSWKFSCTGSGSSTFTSTVGSYPPNTITTNWTPPAPSTGTSYQLSGLSIPSTDGNFSSAQANTTRKADIVVNAVVTLSWVHGTGQTDANDPAPPSVMLVESSGASWTAQADNYPNPYTTGGTSADDGIGDKPVSTFNGSVKSGEYSSSANASVTNGLPSNWKKYTVSSGTLTLTRAFSAHMTVSSGGSENALNYACSFDGYGISIHAQPYGWYDVGWTDSSGTHHAGPVADNTNGTLTFEYGWRSTDGLLADLQGITMYEYLSYSGPGTFSSDRKTFYPGPPTTSGYNVFNGQAGSSIDPTHLYAVDTQSSFPTKSPLTAVTWTAAQKYEFDDPATGEVGTVLYDPGNITDAVQLNPNQFSVSKSGYTATKPL